MRRKSCRAPPHKSTCGRRGGPMSIHEQIARECEKRVHAGFLGKSAHAEFHGGQRQRIPDFRHRHAGAEYGLLVEHAILTSTIGHCQNSADWPHDFYVVELVKKEFRGFCHLDEFCGGYFLLCHSHNAPRTVAQLRARRWQEMAGRGSGYDANINRDSLETLHLYGGPQTSSTVPYIFRASSRASDCSNISAWSRDR